MKKIATLILFTLSGSLEARIPKINPKWVAAVATTASSAYGYYKKDELQKKAVETTLHLIDEYAKPEKKDTYVSTVFNGLKNYKPSLLPVMKDHYEKRFFEHIKNEKAPHPIEEQSLQEYAEVIAPQITKIPAQTASYLINHNRPTHELFTKHAIQNIKSLKGEIAQLLIDKEPKESRLSLKKRIMYSAKENFKDIDPNVLGALLPYDNELKDILVELAVKHPAKKYNNCIILWALFDSPYTEADVNRLKKLTECARKYLNIVPSQFLKEILIASKYIKNNKFPYTLFSSSSLADTFIDEVVQNINSINPEKLNMILNKMNHKNRAIVLDKLHDCINRSLPNITFSLNEITNNNDNRIQLIQIYNKHAHWFRKPLPVPSLPQQLSQTEAHALIMHSAIKELFGNSLDKKSIKKFIDTLHTQEKIEQESNRITFVHGCAWEWDLKQDLFTKLMEIKYQKNFNNYRFLRFKPDFAETIEDEQMHQKLNAAKASELRKDVLFMNHALFGNSTWSGSCTFDYWLNSHDQSVLQNRNDFTPADLFKNAGLEQYFEKYKNEVQLLEHLHQKAANKGLILLISANRDEADNYIYPTKGGAQKIIIHTKDGKHLSKASECIDKLKNDPINLSKKLDRSEYGMLLSNRYALNPDKAGKDIKIFPFSLAHGTKEYKAYCKKRDQLINKIKQDIEEEKNPSIKQDRIAINLLSTATN